MGIASSGIGAPAPRPPGSRSLPDFPPEWDADAEKTRVGMAWYQLCSSLLARLLG